MTAKKDDVLDKNYHLMVLLQSRAPGTYNHSRNVSSLMEAVASEAGLDEEKMKIAGLYHDIGKTVNARYFTENQEPGEKNPHDDLKAPEMLRFITAHVGDTAQILINDPNIDPEIVRWCTQHHGNCVLRPAMFKAEDSDPEKWRYKCHRPASQEAALLMVCDHLEARSNSLSQQKKLPEDISELVETVFRELEADDQLEDIAFKFGELKRIKKVLARELSSQFPGTRTPYPEDEKENEKKRKKK